MVELREHPPDLAIAPLAQHDAQQRRVAARSQPLDRRDPNPAVGKPDPLPKPVHRLPRHLPGRQYLVRLRNAVPGMRQPLRQRPVVRQQHQPRALLVQPAHGVQSVLRPRNQVHDGPAPVRIVRRAQTARGLVHEPVHELFRLDPLPVEADLLSLRIDPRPELRRRLAVDRDPPGENEFLASPPRTDPRGRKHLLKPLSSLRSRRLGQARPTRRRRRASHAFSLWSSRHDASLSFRLTADSIYGRAVRRRATRPGAATARDSRGGTTLWLRISRCASPDGASRP